MKRLLLFFLVLGLFTIASMQISRESQMSIRADGEETWYYKYPKGPRVDTMLKPYVDTFLVTCELRGFDIMKKFNELESITFSPLPGVISGVCMPKHNQVYIDIMTSKNYPDGLKLLIFHELGHCVLGLAHVPMDEKLAIMNPQLDFKNLDKYYDDWDSMLKIHFSSNHPKLDNTNQCCPDLFDDPCTHNGDKTDHTKH